MIKRVLVPTDFSDHADRALTVAIGFAKTLSATIDLVHATRRQCRSSRPSEERYHHRYRCRRPTI